VTRSLLLESRREKVQAICNQQTSKTMLVVVSFVEERSYMLTAGSPIIGELAALRTSSIFFLAAIPKRSHPFPSRTRKLSFSGPMVLQGQPCGRVGRCRGFEGPLTISGEWAFSFFRLQASGHAPPPRLRFTDLVLRRAGSRAWWGRWRPGGGNSWFSGLTVRPQVARGPAGQPWFAGPGW
jgi:hypothetical protein